MSRSGTLSGSDHRMILEVLDGLSGAVDADEFDAEMVRGVRTAVPSDIVALNEVDPAKDRVVFIAEPDGTSSRATTSCRRPRPAAPTRSMRPRRPSSPPS